MGGSIVCNVATLQPKATRHLCPVFDTFHGMRKRRADKQQKFWPKDPFRQLTLDVELLQVSVAEPPAPEYAPLPSVWEGSDAELLRRMLDFYPRCPPKLIMDATVNAGRFWEGSDLPVLGLDIEARHRPAIVGDNTRMPFADSCFDVVVYDPPHVPNQGADKSKDFNDRFGWCEATSRHPGKGDFASMDFFWSTINQAVEKKRPQMKRADY